MSKDCLYEQWVIKGVKEKKVFFFQFHLPVDWNTNFTYNIYVYKKYKCFGNTLQ